VVCDYDARADEVTEVWASEDVSAGGLYVTLSGLNEVGDCALVGEGFQRAPEIAVIRQEKYLALKSFDCGYSQLATVTMTAQHVSWQAPDGLRIQGWLLLPDSKPPYPLIMNVHGGPVWHWRPRWLGRDGLDILMLLKRGYAIFHPNPRGSAGRGQDFASQVVGDLGGADTGDYLSGLDYLVEQGIADPRRLGVIGVSYGGFVASWLITQDARFAAAVSISPITNFVTAHLLSNISHFAALFLGDPYNEAGGKYFTRSPVMYASSATTPTLNVCGALDRCTPPEEALQFHKALLENEVKSVLLTYPEEGHGVHKLPALFDCSARIVSWFEQHMPSQPQVATS
jgi:dipeptidyl aminopeptidase/acylaminoacyl peptidase